MYLPKSKSFSPAKTELAVKLLTASKSSLEHWYPGPWTGKNRTVNAWPFPGCGWFGRHSCCPRGVHCTILSLTVRDKKKIPARHPDYYMISFEVLEHQHFCWYALWFYFRMQCTVSPWTFVQRHYHTVLLKLKGLARTTIAQRNTVGHKLWTNK